MTRILIVEPAGDLRGSERALLDLIDAMPAAEIAVCCPPGRPLVAELAKRHVTVFASFVYALHRKSRWQRAGAALAVLRACLAFKPDVIHLNQAGAYRVVSVAARLLRLPVVVHVRLFEDAAYLAARRPSLRDLSGLIAVSAAIAEELRRFSVLDRIPVHQIYDPYCAQGTEGCNIRPHARAAAIAYVGQLDPSKGTDLLVSAIDAIAGRRSDVVCLVAGAGDDALVDRLKTAARSSAIRWLGFVPDAVAMLRDCAVLACPSHREPLGRVILEAWSAGAVPVVYAGSGGAAEIVRASQGGLIYSNQNVESLAEALERALELRPEAAAALVGGGRRWMRRHCDPVAAANAVMRVLEDASAKRRAGA